MTGHDAQSAVASELTAMFELAIFPWIRSFYTKPELHNGKDFETLCKEYCAARGMPESMWVQIDCPCNFVIDNDPRHALMRQYMAVPRDPQLREQKQQWLSALRDAQAQCSQAEPAPPPAKRAATVPEATAHASEQDACHAVLQRDTSAAPAELLHARTQLASVTREQATLARYKEQHGVDYYQHCMWKMAAADKRYCRILPQQFADHPPNSPEMNSPAEHMVYTIKWTTTSDIKKIRCDFEKLKRGVTYQEMIERAVAERGNGDAGRWHIMRSVEKLECIHKILAADAGAEVTVQYIFKRWAPHEHPDKVEENPAVHKDHGRHGHPEFDKNKRSVHEMRGTAGGYIRDRRFT